MNYKKTVFNFLFFTLFFLTMFFLSLYLYDPLQIFHQPIGREATFHPKMRLQAAGIINNYDYDSVILGTSVLENTSSDEANKLFDKKYLNLSIGGSSFYERQIVLKSILNKKNNVKQVIFSFDSVYLIQATEREDIPVNSYAYLYDGWKINDFKAYLNKDSIYCLFKFSTSKKCIGFDVPYNTPKSWHHIEKYRARFGGLENWIQHKEDPQIEGSLRDIRHAAYKIIRNQTALKTSVKDKVLQAKQYVDDYFLNLVKKHTQTEFIVIFPPYSRIRFAIWAQTNKEYYEVHKAIVKYMSEKDDELSNLKVFAFENEEFLDNIAQYKDLTHYEKGINSWMLRSVKNEYGRLDSKNLPHYFQSIDEKNLNFDLLLLQNQIDFAIKYSRTR
ncbi:MAG: hypothetical protein OQL19_08495 [Gammaproteobacteria bacterium]|nr:hypothetical protein [Gammaproteobacteria bacterium]